jgi:hypothetical protein
MDSSLVENQARALRIALDNGTVTREAYVANMLRVMGLTDHPSADRLSAAFVEGRIDADLLDRNLASLRRPSPDSEPDPIDMAPLR